MATWTSWAVAALGGPGSVRVYARDRPGLEGAMGVSGRAFGRRGAWHLARAALSDLRTCDHVLATTWPVATWAARVLPRDTSLHVVLHGSDVMACSNPAAFRRVARRARVWAVSDALVRQARRLGVEAHRLPVPVPPMPEGPGGPVWTFVGRAIRAKGGERFVRLVAASGKRGIVIGDGPELARWQALAARLGAAIEFEGALSRTETLERIGASELVLLLSRIGTAGQGEGLGLTLLEAAAQGVPTVGSSSGGIPEAAQLVLTDPEDAVGSVREIEAWLTETRGAEARAWVEATHGVRPFLNALRT